MDKIIIKDLNIFAYHGVHDSEKEQGQNFILDITVWTSLERPCRSDNVADTVSYSDIIKVVTRVFTAQKFDLIERAAQQVSDSIFEEFSQIEECEILLKKPDAPIKAEFNYVAVEIRRKRNG